METTGDLYSDVIKLLIPIAVEWGGGGGGGGCSYKIIMDYNKTLLWYTLSEDNQPIVSAWYNYLITLTIG